MDLVEIVMVWGRAGTYSHCIVSLYLSLCTNVGLSLVMKDPNGSFQPASLLPGLVDVRLEGDWNLTDKYEEHRSSVGGKVSMQ